MAKYWLKRALGSVFLWLDDYINHRLLESIVEHFPYWVWKNTCRRFCLFVCDHFEEFEDEKA